MNTFRLYSLCNLYMCGSIHAGIQTAHAVSELHRKYDLSEGYDDLSEEGTIKERGHQIVTDWSELYRTIYVYNGGTRSKMESILEHMNKQAIHPFAHFIEPDAAESMLSSIVVILPQTVYENIGREVPHEILSDPVRIWEAELTNLITKCPFA